MEETNITVNLNGKQVEAKSGERLIKIIRDNGISISHPCYHEALTETGHCGLCLVGARRKLSDEFQIVFSCTATASDGMEIDTNFLPAVEKRKDLILLYLIKHPLDCSKCDKVGNCFLHKFSSQTKFRGFTRIVNGRFDTSHYEKFSNDILFDRGKCINCQRCVRFCRDVIGEEIIGLIRNDRGIKEIKLYPGKTLTNNYSLNLIELCPAGAFVNKHQLHQPAEWDLIKTPSISTESSIGINTYVIHDRRKIFRIIPRKNEFVNGYWMTNSARQEHRSSDIKNRLTKIFFNGKHVQLKTALIHMIKAMSNEISVVLSGNMSLEDQFALSNLLSLFVSHVYFIRKCQRGDEFLISDDAASNFNGAVLTGLALDKNIVYDLSLLNEKIQKRHCKKLLVINEDIFSYGVSYAIPEDMEIFFIGPENNRTAKRSNLVIPTATIYESTGTLINKDWRLQRFYQAINPPRSNIFPGWYIFSLLSSMYYSGSSDIIFRIDKLWKEMANSMESLKDVDLLNMPMEGILVKNH